MKAYWGLRDLRGDRVRTLCENLRILAAAVVQFQKAAEAILAAGESPAEEELEYLKNALGLKGHGLL